MSNGSFLDDMIAYLKPHNGKFLRFENINIAWALGARECTIDFSQVNRGNEAFNRLVVDYIISYLDSCDYTVKHVSYPGKYVTAQAPQALRFNV